MIITKNLGVLQPPHCLHCWIRICMDVEPINNFALFFLQFIFDLKPKDVFGCLADLGWIAGHSSVVYGPLCNGGTTVLFESVATYPDCGTYITLQPSYILKSWACAYHKILGIAQIFILSLTCREVLGDGRPAEDHTLVHNSNCHEVSDESWRWACWQIQALVTESCCIK